MVVLPTTRYIVSVCQSHRSTADTLYQVVLTTTWIPPPPRATADTSSVSVSRRGIAMVCQPHRATADTPSVSVSRIARLQTRRTKLFSQLRGYQSHLARLQIHHQYLSAAEVLPVSCSCIARLQIHHPCLSAASLGCRHIVPSVLTTRWIPPPPRATADTPSVSVSRRGIISVL